MEFMFSFCNSLISLDLSHFNISSNNDMSFIFYGCNGNLIYCVNNNSRICTAIANENQINVQIYVLIRIKK